MVQTMRSESLIILVVQKLSLRETIKGRMDCKMKIKITGLNFSCVNQSINGLERYHRYSMATRGQTILIPWAHYTYTMAWASYAHACNICVCVLGAYGSSSRDNNMHVDHSQHFYMHTPNNHSHSMLKRWEWGLEEPFLLRTFSSWLWTCWTIRSKATKFSPPGATIEMGNTFFML